MGGTREVGVIQPYQQSELCIALDLVLTKKLEPYSFGSIKPHQVSIYLEGVENLQGRASVGLFLD